jgi:hypothetical protein
MTWAIVDCGKILWQFGRFQTKEEAQDKIDSLSYFGDLLSVIEIDDMVEINTEYVNDRNIDGRD